MLFLAPLRVDDAHILVALAAFAISSLACSNKVEADPAPPVPTSIPTGAVSSEIATVVLRAPPMSPRPPAPIPLVAPGPSAVVSSASSAAAAGAP